LNTQYTDAQSYLPFKLPHTFLRDASICFFLLEPTPPSVLC
jgi:hypothetical protein